MLAPTAETLPQPDTLTVRMHNTGNPERTGEPPDQTGERVPMDTRCRRPPDLAPECAPTPQDRAHPHTTTPVPMSVAHPARRVPIFVALGPVAPGPRGAPHPSHRPPRQPRQRAPILAKPMRLQIDLPVVKTTHGALGGVLSTAWAWRRAGFSFSTKTETGVPCPSDPPVSPGTGPPRAAMDSRKGCFEWERC